MPISRSKGFSIVELLVGTAIALVGMVVMFQSMQSWEGRKRTTSSGSDAQVAGSIAIFNLERDIRMAGHGFGSATAELGCAVKGHDNVLGADIPDFLMVPVLIANGAAGAPDVVTVLYGNGTTLSSEMPFTGSATTTKTANNADGLKVGDLFIAATTGGAACGLFETTANPPGIGATIAHATAAYTNYQGVSTTPRYNDGGDRGIPVGTNTAGMLFNLGTTPRLNVWQLTGGRLSVNNILANETASDVAEAIVNVQAQYGYDQDNDGFIAAVVNAGGNQEWVDTLATPTSTDWRRVRAIRVALLARSQQFEQANVTTVNPSWAGGNFVMTHLDGTAGSTDPDSPNNWRRYRYRVYETVVPLRNAAWGAS
jgi:type IV pilus assembly protein PilW